VLDDHRNGLRDAYLARLGVEAEPPSVEALQRILAAQLARVPYETTWIALGEAWTIDPFAAAERVARHGRGGYCFHLNGALAELLDDLGYHVVRHVGGVHGPDGPAQESMTNHLVLTVTCLATDENPGGRWYVDAGLGDGPIEALALGEVVLDSGEYHYSFGQAAADGLGDWHFVHDAIRGSFTGMVFLDRPAARAEFETRHRFLSTSPESGFVKVPTAQRRTAEGTTILRACTLTHVGATRSAPTFVTDRGEWFALAAEEFGLTYAGVPDAAKDRLWTTVLGAHRSWEAQQTAADAADTVSR